MVDSVNKQSPPTPTPSPKPNSTPIPTSAPSPKPNSTPTPTSTPSPKPIPHTGAVDSKTSFEVTQNLHKKAANTTSTASTPVGSTPEGVAAPVVGSTPIGSIPVGSTPIGSTPVGSSTEITKESSLQYLYDNFDIFDTGAGIGDPDKKVSNKDFNALKDSTNLVLAENAKKLIDENIASEIGGDDKKFTKDELITYLSKDFNINDKYNNINVDKKTFSSEELSKLNESLFILANDPDGKILLENTNKNHRSGFTIQKDAKAAADHNAFAYVSGSHLVLGVPSDDQARNLRRLSHELTHAATEEGIPSNGTGEALANVIAAKIGYRNYGEFETRNYGHSFTFDGSSEAQAKVYHDTLLDTYKKDGSWPRAGYSYEGLPDFSYGEYLESLGFQFDFPFEIDVGQP